MAARLRFLNRARTRRPDRTPVRRYNPLGVAVVVALATLAVAVPLWVFVAWWAPFALLGAAMAVAWFWPYHGRRPD